MSNVEMRSLFAKLCHLDELLSLIEEFLMGKKVLVYNNASPESFVVCDSRFSILVDGVDRIMSFETASTHQLVAGSIILASICTAIDHIGFICEASYDIFRMHRSDSSLLLTILHVFAHVCGKKYFTLSNYCLIMTVMKSLVTISEGRNLSIKTTSCLSSQSKVQNEFPPCIKCPFSQNAASVDIVISLLLEKLQDYAISDAVDQELIKSDKSLNSGSLSSEDKAEKKSHLQEAFCVHSMKCDMPCCFNDFVMPAIQSGSDFNRTLCHFIDILSLVELVASSMSWEWTCNKVVPRLLKMLNLCDMDDTSAAIVILLGQLGR
ncbi:hypothetical protein CK203_003794 [Vitis vinifera]|nr:hypothetical protein CK203_003794 [Vitis vinifera]